MPELAAVYFAGLMTCLTLTLIYILLRRQRRKSAEFTRLQHNLRSIGLYWSEYEEKMKPWFTTEDVQEAKRSDRNITIAGSLLSFLSWGGVLFLLIIMISDRFLARSRTERRLLDSNLAKSSVSPDSVRTQIKDLGLEL